LRRFKTKRVETRCYLQLVNVVSVVEEDEEM